MVLKPQVLRMTGQYNHSLVLLSFVIATLGAWAALDLSSRAYQHKSRQRKAVWLSLGAAPDLSFERLGMRQCFKRRQRKHVNALSTRSNSSQRGASKLFPGSIQVCS